MAEASPVLLDYPNPRLNVFIMMRFRDSSKHTGILDALTRSLGVYGIHALRADQRSYADSLWANVRSYIEACELGIAVFEQIDDRDFNPNVSLELGYMMATNKKLLLLKEASLPSLPTDIVGHLYRSFSVADLPTSVEAAVRLWLRDIGVAKSAAEKLVLFVSHGGTCRCAMAKVILERLLEGRQLPYRLRVMSVANSFGANDRASKGARRAIVDLFGTDYLESHRVTRRNAGLIADADLILPMEEDCNSNYPPEKTVLFNKFFGGDGPVRNPWPDDDTPAAQIRYHECILHLHATLSSGVDRLLLALDSGRNFGG